MVFIVVILLAAVMRGLFLDADPPLGLWDSGPYHDEGQYTHNARNMALFGAWRTDEYNNMYISPVLNLLTYLSFRLFGVGHWQARLVSVIFSLATLVCLYVGLRRTERSGVVLLAVTLLGLDYFFLIYSRTALMDVPTMFWMTLSFCGWQYAITGRPVGAFVTGGAAAMAWIFKSLALPFLLVPIFSLVCFHLLLRKQSSPPRTYSIGALILTGMGTVLLIWAVAFYLPNQSEVSFYTNVFAQERMPSRLADLAAALWRNFRWLEPARLTPFLFTGASIGVLTFAADNLRTRRAAGWGFLMIWLATSASTLYLSPYSPGRYWTIILPPLAAFSAYGAWAFTHPSRHPLFTVDTVRSRAVWGLILAVPVVALFVLEQNFIFIAPALNRRAVRYPFYALALAYWVATTPMLPWAHRVRTAWAQFAQRRGSLILAAIVVAVLAWDVYHYAGMVTQRRYTLSESARWLDDFLPHGAVVLGSGATTVTMETDLVVIPTWIPNNAWVNADRPWEKYGATYWIEALLDHNGTPYTPPLAGVELIAEFEAQGRAMGVWRLPNDD